MALGVVALSSCSSKTDSNPQAASVTANNVTLTAAQRAAHSALHRSRRPRFTKRSRPPASSTSTTTRRPACWRPSPARSRGCSFPSATQVKEGDCRWRPWIRRTSPRPSAPIARRSRPPRPTAELADLDKDLLAASRRFPARSGPGANRRRQRRSRPRRRPAGARLAAASIRRPSRPFRKVEPVSRAAGVIRSPIAGTVVEKLITPGQLLQAGTTPCFTVADLSRVWVMAQLFGSDLASVSVGDPAEVVTGDRCEQLLRDGRQHLGAGGSRHPFGAGARGGRQSRRAS